jgi:hypothetical protein
MAGMHAGLGMLNLGWKRCLVLSMTAGALSAVGCAYSTHARHWLGAMQTGLQVHRVAPDPATMKLRFHTGVCMSDPLVETSIWMTDLPLDALAAGDVKDGLILHVELLFRPRPGYTPLDATATNLAIRYIVLSRGEVGIYQGGGYGYPVGSLEGGSMSLNIQNASLSLGDHTAGFVDLLTPAVLSGTFNGPRNEAIGATIRDGADVLVSAALGRRTYVRLDDSAPTRNMPLAPLHAGKVSKSIVMALMGADASAISRGLSP